MELCNGDHGEAREINRTKSIWDSCLVGRGREQVMGRGWTRGRLKRRERRGVHPNELPLLVLDFYPPNGMSVYCSKGGTVIRPDEMERAIRQSHPKLPTHLPPSSSTAELSHRLTNAGPVWSIYSSANPYSYWPYRYLSDPNSHENYWQDPHNTYSALHRPDLFGKSKPPVDYIANNHFWNYPYPHWARHRGYLYDYANPSFYSKEYDLNYFEI